MEKQHSTIEGIVSHLSAGDFDAFKICAMLSNMGNNLYLYQLEKMDFKGSEIVKAYNLLSGTGSEKERIAIFASRLSELSFMSDSDILHIRNLSTENGVFYPETFIIVAAYSLVISSILHVSKSDALELVAKELQSQFKDAKGLAIFNTLLSRFGQQLAYFAKLDGSGQVSGYNKEYSALPVGEKGKFIINFAFGLRNDLRKADKSDVSYIM
ncbi:MAG: hypothetical protein ACP5FR_03135 [Candidatus Micrarchaeia archaeon]